MDSSKLCSACTLFLEQISNQKFVSKTPITLLQQPRHRLVVVFEISANPVLFTALNFIREFSKFFNGLDTSPDKFFKLDIMYKTG